MDKKKYYTLAFLGVATIYLICFVIVGFSRNKENYMDGTCVKTTCLVQGYSKISKEKSALSEVERGLYQVPNKDKAIELLGDYGLHIDKKLYSSKEIMGDDYNYNLIYEVSEDIGLHLKKYKGKKLTQDVYKIKEQSQGGEKDVKAFIIFDEVEEIVGAYLSYEGYTTNIASLKDKSELMPEGIKKDKLDFKNVYKVEILSSSSKEDSWNKERILSKEDMNKLIGYLSSLKGKKDHNVNKENLDAEQYLIMLYYNGGPIVRARLYCKENYNKITFDNVEGWSYEVNKEIVDFMVSAR